MPKATAAALAMLRGVQAATPSIATPSAKTYISISARISTIIHVALITPPNAPSARSGYAALVSLRI